MNVHGSWRNHALALGMEKDASCEISSSICPGLPALSGRLERVRPAPWQEVVVEKDVNLFELMPLFRLIRGDWGYFIDKPCDVSRDPDDWTTTMSKMWACTGCS